MPDYDDHYELMQRLQDDPRIIPQPLLYNLSEAQLYAALMDRLAQDLPNGKKSPFQDKSPGTAHAVLMGAVAYLQELYAHEMNLLPDRNWVDFFRLLGVQRSPAEYPVINLVFVGRVGSVIPANTQVKSSVTGTSVYTTQPAIVESNGQVSVAARFTRLGTLPSLRTGEFALIPNSPSGIIRVYNDGTVINQGKPLEALPSTMLRARQLAQAGFRCASDRDFYNYAIQFGAQKANVFRGQQAEVDYAHYSDLVTVAIYPPARTAQVRTAILGVVQGEPRADYSGTLLDERVDVIAAEIIPVGGRVQIRVTPDLSDTQAFNLAANAIVGNINPPNGVWGDRRFEYSLATALERVDGIFAVPEMELIRSDTGIAIADITPQPWQLFEIQSSIAVEILR